MNLVSEHIWCNDFLVRSFYLKNVQTQETRTLTQFHFLSWPAQGIPTSTRPLLDFRRYCFHHKHEQIYFTNSCLSSLFNCFSLIPFCFIEDKGLNHGLS